MTETLPIRVVALYRFTPFADIAAIQPPLAKVCCTNGVKGTLLLAAEGINGTIAGSQDGIDAVLAHIRGLPGCADLDVKLSGASFIGGLGLPLSMTMKSVWPLTIA